MTRASLAALVVLVLSTPIGLRGQVQQDTIPPAAGETPQAEGPDFGSVNAALQDVERLRSRLTDRARIEALEGQLQGLEERFATTVEGPFLAAPVASMDRTRAQEFLSLLSRFSVDVDRANQAVAVALAEVVEIQDSLGAFEDRWSQVVTQTDTADMVQQVDTIVRSLLVLADAGQEEARDLSGELVALQGRGLALGTRITTLTREAEAREALRLADLLEVDSGPIWTVLDGSVGAELMQDLATVPETLREGLADLWTAYRGRLVVHGFLGLLFLAMVLGMRGSPALKEAPDLETATRILAHPLAVALMLTLALTQPLYPTAQPAVLALNTVLFLAAELVVIRAALPFVPPVVAWVGGAFLGVARLSYLLPFDTIGHRLAFLLSAVGSLVLLGVIWRLLQAHPDRITAPWQTILSRILIVFAVLLGMALLANVVGMVSFAVLVTRSMIRSFLSGLGILTLAVVLGGLVQVGLRTAPLSALRSVRSYRSEITATVWRLITWSGFLAWIWAHLVAFRLLDPLVQATRQIMAFQIRLGALNIAPANVVLFVFFVWLAVYVSRVTRFFLNQDVLPRLSLPRGVPGAISTSLHYVIVGLALAFGVTAMGIDVSSLAFVVGALGVGIGFGLQNIINNFISGLILLFERPIQIGDEVQVGQLMGTVKRIGIRASIVRTYDGAEVIVPNGDLISQQVVNFTLSDRYRRLELRVGVAYGTDLERARETILHAMTSLEQVLDHPAPAVVFSGFGESSLDFRVLCWVPDFGMGLETASALGMAINRALTEANIVIPFPQRDLHLRTVSGPGEMDLTRTVDQDAGQDAPES